MNGWRTDYWLINQIFYCFIIRFLKNALINWLIDRSTGWLIECQVVAAAEDERGAQPAAVRNRRQAPHREQRAATGQGLMDW